MINIHFLMGEDLHMPTSDGSLNINDYAARSFYATSTSHVKHYTLLAQPLRFSLNYLPSTHSSIRATLEPAGIRYVSQLHLKRATQILKRT